jgi:hypothetical protein
MAAALDADRDMVLALAESLVTQKAETAAAEVVSTTIAKSIRGANAQDLFTQSARHSGALTPEPSQSSVPSQTDSEATTLRNTSQVSVPPLLLQAESPLLVTMQGVSSPYPYGLRPDWLCLSALTTEEKNAVSAAQSNKSYATALPMQPGNLGLQNELNGNLTFKQLQCLKPNIWLNDAVINVVLGLLQWQTKDVLVLSTFAWIKYQRCSRGTWGGKLQLRRSIVKHMKNYKVRSAVVSTSHR